MVADPFFILARTENSANGTPPITNNGAKPAKPATVKAPKAAAKR